MDLTPDDIECLIAIARQAQMPGRMVLSCMERLQAKGLVTAGFDCPKLSPLGQAELEKVVAKASLALDLSMSGEH